MFTRICQFLFFIHNLHQFAHAFAVGLTLDCVVIQNSDDLQASSVEMEVEEIKMKRVTEP